MPYEQEPDTDAPSAQDLVNEHSDALKQVLREMSAVYYTYDCPVEIKFGSPPCADRDGRWVQIDQTMPQRVDPDVRGPLILKMLDDVLCHEVAHLNWSDLESKADFVDEYSGWGEIPGMVSNILEDAYVDARRCREWYGMRKKSAYTSWLLMETEELSPPIDHVDEERGRANALVEALNQLSSAGYINYDDASAVDSDVWEFLQTMEVLINRIRLQDDRDQRYKLFHAAMQTLMEYCDEPESFTPDAFDDIVIDIDGLVPAPSGDPDDADGPDVDDLKPDQSDVAETTVTIDDPEEDEDDEEDGTIDEEVPDGPASPGAGYGDPSEALSDHYDVDVENVDAVDLRDERKWDQLQERLDDFDSDVEKRTRERDEKARDGKNAPYAGVPHEEVRTTATNRSVIDDLKQGFRELVTRPAPRPAEVGPRMDAPNVVRHAAGDVTATDLFEEETITETGDRCIGICADTSSSMGSHGMRELKVAAACIATATDIIGDGFVFSSFCGSRRNPRLQLVTGPDEEFEWWHLDCIRDGGGTPTHSGIRDCHTLMQEVDAREYVMIVITDGAAADVPASRDAVEECRQNGVEVIGLGVGGVTLNDMEKQFGGDGYRKTSISNLADDVLQLYRSRMDVERR